MLDLPGYNATRFRRGIRHVVSFEKDAWHICSSYSLSCLHRTVVSHEVVVSSDFQKRGMGLFVNQVFHQTGCCFLKRGISQFPRLPNFTFVIMWFHITTSNLPHFRCFFLMYPLAIERSYGKSPCSVGN